jgi:nucleoside phosphorylase
MLSASVLVDSRAFREDLVRRHPDAFAGEMEGAGVYAAAAAGRVDWIVVKAISDWGYDKTHDHQQEAAAAAADLLVHMVRTGALDEPVGAA